MAALDNVGTVESPCVADHVLLRCIGRGAYGEVWLARSALGTYRGVKIVRREKFEDERPYEREFEGIKEFEPISRKHEGFISILQVGRNDERGYFYCVMEVADDVKTSQDIHPDTYAPRTLATDRRNRSRLAPAECGAIGAELTSALAFLHGRGLIHRDIKPSNIIFVNGRAKLADIGLVTRSGEFASQVGTFGYLAPEGPGAPPADLFSLGKVLYQLAAGKDVDRFPELPTSLSEDRNVSAFIRLNEIILKACDPNPRARYQSAEEMGAALLTLTGAAMPPRTVPPPAQSPMQRIALLYKAHAETDARLLHWLIDRLGAEGLQVFYDKKLPVGVEWAKAIESKICDADAVVVLLSAESVKSEMVAYEIEIAHQAAQRQHGRPLLLPVRVRFADPLPEPLCSQLGRLQYFPWEGPQDNERLVSELMRAVGTTQRPLTTDARPRIEPSGGAVPLQSEFYVVRPTDHEFQTAIARRDSIVLVKGARQMGKTSLLARGLQLARQTGAKVVLSDLQKLSLNHLKSPESFFLALGESLADQLDLSVLPKDAWDERRSPNTNFERYLRREVLGKASAHFVWGLDEVDRLFTCEFGSEVFGLFRSWHNERALDPTGPWSRLTLAIAYATEAHLFITDVNQSPFNVGTRLVVEDFTPDQIADLNHRHGAPLRDEAQLRQLYTLLGGQPYLVRRGLNELASNAVSFKKFVDEADRDEGIYGDHLRRMLVLLARDTDLTAVVRGILRGQPCANSTSFYRLRSAGLLNGDSPVSAQPRCEIYATYLKRHLL